MLTRYILSLWPWFIASLLAAGIIHILTVFGVPYVATQDAWARLRFSVVGPLLASPPPLPASPPISA